MEPSTNRRGRRLRGRRVGAALHCVLGSLLFSLLGIIAGSILIGSSAVLGGCTPQRAIDTGALSSRVGSTIAVSSDSSRRLDPVLAAEAAWTALDATSHIDLDRLAAIAAATSPEALRNVRYDLAVPTDTTSSWMAEMEVCAVVQVGAVSFDLHDAAWPDEIIAELEMRPIAEQSSVLIAIDALLAGVMESFSDPAPAEPALMAAALRLPGLVRLAELAHSDPTAAAFDPSGRLDRLMPGVRAMTRPAGGVP